MADATELVVFSVTPEAVARILELREQEDDAEGMALRVEVTGVSGVEYAYDLTFDPLAEATEVDAVYHQGDLPVVVPVGSIEQLTGATLDIPAATVRTRYFRARALLREALAREIDFAIEDAFGFDGARCDRIVDVVRRRLEAESS